MSKTGKRSRTAIETHCNQDKRNDATTGRDFALRYDRNSYGDFQVPLLLDAKITIDKAAVHVGTYVKRS
jgi:hypothetical protein